MVLFGFHPLIVGFLSYVFFAQTVPTHKLWAIIFMVLCLLTFSYESFKTKGHWDIVGLGYAFLGMVFDAVGVIITRYAFDLNSAITSFEGNVHRCLGAHFAYFVISRFRPFQFRGNFKLLTRNSKMFVTIGAIFGTYLSLAMYLRAIQSGNLALVSGISITSVIFSSTFESIWEKKKPSKYLIISFLFFFAGMYLLV